MSLTVNIATRGRPELLLRTIEAVTQNMRRPDTTLMVSIDEDDDQTKDALKDSGVLISCKPREDTVAEKWNRAITEAPADCYLPTTDYAPYIVPGFDAVICEAASRFPDGIGCVYGPPANLSFPCMQVMTAGLVQKLGYIYPPYYPFWFVDHWIDDVVKMIGRIFTVPQLNDYSTLRPGTTTGLRELMFWTTAFDAARIVRRSQALAIIDGDDFLSPEWIKDMLRRRIVDVENHSFFINECVRQHADDIERTRGDPNPPSEGYVRLKAAQQKMALSNFEDLQRAA